MSKGRRPILAAKLAVKAIMSNAALMPPAPKRIAAQKKTGSTKTRVVDVEPGIFRPIAADPNDRTAAAVKAQPSSNTSRNLRFQISARRGTPRVATSTTSGTTLNSVSEFEKTRVRQTVQNES